MTHTLSHEPAMRIAGVPVWIDTNTAGEFVTITVIIEAGSADDPTDKAGLASITARMLRRGASDFLDSDFQQALERLAAELVVYADMHTTTIYVSCLSRTAPAVFELVKVMLAAPTFNDRSLQDLLIRAQEEHLQMLDDDSWIAHRILHQEVYGDHPYGSSLSTCRSVAQITRDDVVGFYKTKYHGGLLSVGVAGCVNETLVRNFVDSLVWELGDSVARGDAPPADPLPLSGPRILLVDRPERAQVKVVFGSIGPDLSETSMIPNALVLNTAFGGMGSSLLMQEIRDRQGMSYDASSAVLLDRWRGVFLVQCDPPAERLGKMVSTMRSMLDVLCTHGIEENLLRRAQRHLTEGSCFQRDTATRRVQRTLAAMAIGRAPGFLDEMNAEIGLRTPKQINDAAPSCFSAVKNPVVVLVGNIGDLSMSQVADLLGERDVGQNVEVARVDIDQIVA